jgi:hypothetical protein
MLGKRGRTEKPSLTRVELTFGRPEQLNLPYDPNFILDSSFGLNLDFPVSDLSIDGSRRSSLLSPLSGRSSQSSQNDGMDIGTSSGIGGDVGDFLLPGPLASSAQKSTRPDMHEDSFIEDAAFEFDEEGNIVEIPASRDRQLPEGGKDLTSETGSAVERRVREEHVQGAGAGIGEVNARQPFLLSH